jgi:hypothetical protein
LAAALSALLPAAASADRGALSLELGLSPVLVPRMPAPVRDAQGFPVIALGALPDVRYALGNDFELVATGLFQVPATGNANLLDGLGVVVGTVSTSVASWGAFLGARYVAGLTWRFHLGAELGWTHLSFAGTRVVGIGAASAGAGSPRGEDFFAAASSVGLEWQFNDHMCVGAAPRLQLLLGGAPTLSFLLPVTFGYSWYLF